MSKPFTVENASVLWPAMTLGGLALTALSLLEITDISDSLLGGWGFYTLAIGFLVFIYGVIELYTYLKRMRKLKTILEMNAKASVIKNLEEMEYLAWCLPQIWEERVKEKKKEMHIK